MAMAAAVSRSPWSAAQRNAARRFASSSGEPCRMPRVVADCPTARGRRLPARRSSGHARCGLSSASPVATSCSSANWRIVSSIENRVRVDDRSATTSDLRTSASSRSRVANSSPVPATAHAPVEVESAGEHRTSCQQGLFGVIEQVVRPLHRMAQGLMAFQAAPRPDQQPEPVVEPIAHLGDRHRLQARGGQLDRQRDPVEATADLDAPHRRRRICDSEMVGATA